MLAADRFTRVRSGQFLHRFRQFELRWPLAETSPGYAGFLPQLPDVLTGPHALHGHSLELPRVVFAFCSAVLSSGECARANGLTSRVSPFAWYRIEPTQNSRLGFSIFSPFRRSPHPKNLKKSFVLQAPPRVGRRTP